MHKPIYLPYELYGRVDYIYGWKAYNDHNGFTAAQGIMNIVESLMYIYYLYILFAYGKRSAAHGRGAPKPAVAGFWGEQRYVDGKMAAVAVLVAFSAAVMTVSKTVLYCMVLPSISWNKGTNKFPGLNEYCSGFKNIGHNTWGDLTLLWIIPKWVFCRIIFFIQADVFSSGAWLVLPSYMIYVSCSEIVQGLNIAAGATTPASDDASVIKAPVFKDE